MFPRFNKWNCLQSNVSTRKNNTIPDYIFNGPVKIHRTNCITRKLAYLQLVQVSYAAYYSVTEFFTYNMYRSLNSKNGM